MAGGFTGWGAALGGGDGEVVVVRAVAGVAEEEFASGDGAVVFVEVHHQIPGFGAVGFAAEVL